MKLFHKTIFFVLNLMVISKTITAYEFFVSNFTDKVLIIAFKKRAGIQEKYYQIVPPGGSVVQAWADANCLESLQWAELNPKLPLKGGLELIDFDKGRQIPPNKQKTFDTTFFSKKTGKGLYLWNNLPITFTPNETFEKTVKQAKELAQGIGDLFGRSARDAASFTTKGISKTAENKEKLQKASNWLGDLAEASGRITGESICKPRQFAIYDIGKPDPLTRQPQFIAVTTEGE